MTIRQQRQFVLALMLLTLLGGLLAICGCKSAKPRTATGYKLLTASDMPEPMGTVAAAPVQPEWLVPNVSPAIGPRNMLVAGAIGFVQFDNKLLCFLTAQPTQQRIVTLSNWTYQDNTGGFGISGNTLLLSAQDQQLGPNHTQEYTLTDWQDGLPTRAAFVTAKDYGDWRGNFSRVARMPSGRLVAITTRQEGFTFDVIDRNINGVYTTNYFAVAPFAYPGVTFEMTVREDGRLWVFCGQDASQGTIGLVRFAEVNGKLTFYDYAQLFPKSGALAPDGENPWLQITSDGRFISYQAFASSIGACQPEWFRFCHVNIVELPLIVSKGGKIIEASPMPLDAQHVRITYESFPDQNYQVMWSTNTVDWHNATVDLSYDLGNNRRLVYVAKPGLSYNPLSFPPCAFQVRAQNYRTELRSTTPEYVERAFSYCSLTSLPNNGLGYFLMPFDVSHCQQLETSWRTLAEPFKGQPADYGRFAQGYGWAFIKRTTETGAAWYLKDLARI